MDLAEEFNINGEDGTNLSEGDGNNRSGSEYKCDNGVVCEEEKNE